MQTNKKRHQSKSYPGNPAHGTHGYSKQNRRPGKRSGCLYRETGICELSVCTNGQSENRNKLRCLFSEKPFTPINTLTETQADEKWFNRLNEIIQENISNTEFSVDQLTRSVNMSRTLLYAKVKAVTGLTPNEFIRLVRLRKAAEYLAGNEYKINEICYMVGFNSPSYFAKCFQNQFGVLPKDFINNTN